jgi:hypothetical protein
VHRALNKRGLTFFDARDPIARHQAVARTIDLSLERLNANELERFIELAVFPEDINIPLATLARLWQRTGGLDDFDTEYLCERLYRLSLTLAFDPALRVVRVHDVIRQYLMGRIGERLPKLHRELLEGHRPESGAWADLSPKDPYLWDHLAMHLQAAGSTTELVATVLDYATSRRRRSPETHSPPSAISVPRSSSNRKTTASSCCDGASCNRVTSSTVAGPSPTSRRRCTRACNTSTRWRRWPRISSSDGEHHDSLRHTPCPICHTLL